MYILSGRATFLCRQLTGFEAGWKAGLGRHDDQATVMKPDLTMI